MPYELTDPDQLALKAFCKRFGVERLDLFGSALTDEFDPERSDLDFVVQFGPSEERTFDRYFGLKEALEAHFSRRVDLITKRSIRNPYLLAEVERTHRCVYAA